MTIAEILTTSTEILPSEIVDTNTHHLSRKLREQEIDLYSQAIVGDNVDRLAQAIRHSVVWADLIITSGGLGPTVDDPTRLAVAKAVGVELEFREELWDRCRKPNWYRHGIHRRNQRLCDHRPSRSAS